MGHLLGSSMLEQMATSSKRAYATCWEVRVCYSQSPCPHKSPLLTSASTRDIQILKGRSGSVSVGTMGPGARKVLFQPAEHLWQLWGLILIRKHLTRVFLCAVLDLSGTLWPLLIPEYSGIKRRGRPFLGLRNPGISHYGDKYALPSFEPYSKRWLFATLSLIGITLCFVNLEF